MVDFQQIDILHVIITLNLIFCGLPLEVFFKEKIISILNHIFRVTKCIAKLRTDFT